MMAQELIHAIPGCAAPLRAEYGDYAVMANDFVAVKVCPFCVALTVAVAWPTQAMRIAQLQV